MKIVRIASSSESVCR